MVLPAARKEMSASQNASGGPSQVPTWYSRPKASTVARSPGGLRYSSIGKTSQSPAWASTTIQTTSRGRARISSTTSEVKRMKRPNAGPGSPVPRTFDRVHEPPRQPASDRERDVGHNLPVQCEEIGLNRLFDGLRIMFQPRGNDGCKKSA